MPQTPPELTVIQKTQELLVWTLNHIANFPRSHRYGLGQRLEHRLSGILDRLIEAKFTRDRLPLLNRCNLELEQLRFEFRTAKDVRCLSIESYGSSGRFVNEIGQNLGQWIKSIGKGSDEATRRSVARTGELPQPVASGEKRIPR